MRISGLTVSVNYSDFLSQSIGPWMAGLDSLTIVTDFNDTQTQDLGIRHGATVYKTDAFTRNGACFNKGLAQQEAWPLVPKDDWILLFDADVLPVEYWGDIVAASNPRPGHLYGCYRFDEHGKRIKDDTHGYGYFQLFHGQDERAKVDPFFDTHWIHAGNGDSSILLRWKTAGLLAKPLPIPLTHAGGPSHNWFGRGEHDKFRRMEAERRRRGGGWSSLEGEKIGAAG